MTPRFPPTPSDLITVSGPLGVVAAVPFLLGFTPVESVLLVCLDGRRSRIGPVLRMDLPLGAEAEDATAAYLAAQAVRHATTVALLCYTEEGNSASWPPSLPRAALVKRCMEAFDGAGVGLLDAMLVRVDRVWSYLRGSAVGRGDPVPSPLDRRLDGLRYSLTGAGRTVLADRAAVRQSVAGPDPSAAADLLEELGTASDRQAAVLAGLTSGEAAEARQRLADGALSLLGNAFRRRHPLPGRALADLLHALDDALIRDRLTHWTLARIDDGALPLLMQLASQTPDSAAAELCILLGIAAYRCGDGALAHIALDRTLAARPDHRVARVLSQLFSSGIEPEQLDALLTRATTAGAAPFSTDRMLR